MPGDRISGQEMRKMMEDTIDMLRVNKELWPSLYDHTAEQLRTLYVKLVENGFTEEQAMQIVCERGTQIV